MAWRSCARSTSGVSITCVIRLPFVPPTWSGAPPPASVRHGAAHRSPPRVARAHFHRESSGTPLREALLQPAHPEAVLLQQLSGFVGIDAVRAPAVRHHLAV